MKITTSKDGKSRFTLNISHRIGLSELADTLFQECETVADFPKSRAVVLKMVRQLCVMRGHDWWADVSEREMLLRGVYHSMDDPEATVETFRRACTEHALALFPEFK